MQRLKPFTNLCFSAQWELLQKPGGNYITVVMIASLPPLQQQLSCVLAASSFKSFLSNINDFVSPSLSKIASNRHWNYLLCSC